MLRRGLLNHGFGGCWQKRCLGKSHRQKGQQHNGCAGLEQRRKGNQAATEAESSQAQPQSKGHAAIGQPSAHRPLQADQKCQLKSNQSTAVAFAQPWPSHPTTNEIQWQRALLERQYSGGDDADSQHRQQRQQPGAWCG